MAKTGLSILIPVFNVDIRSLVRTLIEQGIKLNILFEIKVYDDFSSPGFKLINKEVSTLPFVTYLELHNNIGRSKIRNKLAAESQYTNLLFLDCDSQIEHSDFLRNYWNNIQNDVVVGGRNYTSQPKDIVFTLHWTVGKAKEERSIEDRLANPYKSFMSNNFMIKEKVYHSIQLDEKLEGYGHEDTKFGYELNKNKIEITHISNPVIHLELDNNDDFLKKSDEGIINFYKILNQGYGQDTKLAKAYNLIKKLRLRLLFITFFRVNKKRIKKNLHSAKPSLILFDLYKLNRLLEVSSKSKIS